MPCSDVSGVLCVLRLGLPNFFLYCRTSETDRHTVCLCMWVRSWMEILYTVYTVYVFKQTQCCILFQASLWTLVVHAVQSNNWILVSLLRNTKPECESEWGYPTSLTLKNACCDTRLHQSSGKEKEVKRMEAWRIYIIELRYPLEGCFFILTQWSQDCKVNRVPFKCRPILELLGVLFTGDEEVAMFSPCSWQPYITESSSKGNFMQEKKGNDFCFCKGKH